MSVTAKSRCRHEESLGGVTTGLTNTYISGDFKIDVRWAFSRVCVCGGGVWSVEGSHGDFENLDIISQGLSLLYGEITNVREGVDVGPKCPVNINSESSRGEPTIHCRQHVKNPHCTTARSRCEESLRGVATGFANLRRFDGCNQRFAAVVAIAVYRISFVVDDILVFVISWRRAPTIAGKLGCPILKYTRAIVFWMTQAHVHIVVESAYPRVKARL